jgi:hypothetical protein
MVEREKGCPKIIDKNNIKNACYIIIATCSLNARMAERSKAVDLRPTISGFEGSNPSPRTYA